MPSRPLPPHLAEPKLTYLDEAGTETFTSAIVRGFHDDYKPGLWEPFESPGTDRAFGFTVDGRWIATCGACHRSMTVPGGSVPTAAVTVVTVSPTYRRRGLLTAMMKHQLEDIHRRSEPVALLWASESLIYGRFGYGHATPRLRISGRLGRLPFFPELILVMARSVRWSEKSGWRRPRRSMTPSSRSVPVLSIVMPIVAR